MSEQLKIGIIELTQEDIDQGVMDSCKKCPMALAVSRYCDAPLYAGFCNIWDAQDQWSVHIPDVMFNWMVKFDTGQVVEPFTFPLQLPARLVDAAEARKSA